MEHVAAGPRLGVGRPGRVQILLFALVLSCQGFELRKDQAFCVRSLGFAWAGSSGGAQRETDSETDPCEPCILNLQQVAVIPLSPTGSLMESSAWDSGCPAWPWVTVLLIPSVSLRSCPL